jgi:hypothetical protein
MIVAGLGADKEGAGDKPDLVAALSYCQGWHVPVSR